MWHNWLTHNIRTSRYASQTNITLVNADFFLFNKMKFQSVFLCANSVLKLMLGAAVKVCMMEEVDCVGAQWKLSPKCWELSNGGYYRYHYYYHYYHCSLLTNLHIVMFHLPDLSSSSSTGSVSARAPAPAPAQEMFRHLALELISSHHHNSTF